MDALTPTPPAPTGRAAGRAAGSEADGVAVRAAECDAVGAGQSVTATAAVDGTTDIAAAHRAALARWFREALRTAFFLRPRWQGLRATPAGVAWLALASIALAVALDRLYIAGPAVFYPQAFGMQWFFAAALAAAAWVMRGEPAEPAEPAGRPDPPSAATLFALLWLQSLVVSVLSAIVLLPTLHAGAWGGDTPQAEPLWWAWGPWAWYALALLALAARSADAPPAVPANQAAQPPSTGAAAQPPQGPSAAPAWPARRRWGMAVLLIALAYSYQADLPRYWYPQPTDRGGYAPPWRPSPEALEAQPRLFAEQSAALAAGQPGRIELFALTFAPYADEDVFKRESALVAEVMGARFGAAGRTMQLVNHRETLATLALATPRNLERAIAAAAARMNRDEDILFLHLTSHGAASGALSARFGFLDIGEVRPEQLKAWLDAAGVKWRIVSVSACYSGTWVAPLADEHTLVMTAADAEHTSYGCGRKSELTYFGRAVFDEALRRTRSFEEAHAGARAVIAQREREAGKQDGYSNPQLHVGGAMREQLARWRAELEPEGAAGPPTGPAAPPGRP